MRNTVLSGVFAAVALAALAQPTRVSAQDLGLDVREEALRRIQESEARRRATIDATRYRRIEGGPVSLDEVLRDPDNIGLNFRYAQTQAADGNLLGAATTLERILLLDPNLDRIRMFYAFVLYRLENWIEARAQLEVLESAALSPQDRAEADELRARVERKTRRTVFNAFITAGFTYQTNANFTPETETLDVIVDFLGIPIPVKIPSGPAEDDLAYVASGTLGFVHDLGFQQGHELFGSFSTFWNDQATVDSTDYTDYAAVLGGVWHSPRWGDLSGQLLASHFSLDDDSFLTEYGGELGWERRYLDDRLRADLRVRATHEDYDNADGNTPERTGPRYEYELGAVYRLTQAQLLGASIEYDDKHADEKWREFDRVELTLRHTWLLRRGIFVQNLFAYGNEVYDAPNPRISAKRRHDNDFRYRFTVSVPLERFIGKAPRALRGIRINGSAEYERADSNVQNFEFENVTGELLLSKSFEF